MVYACLLAFASCVNDSKVKEGGNTASSKDKGVAIFSIGTRSTSAISDYTIYIYSIQDSKSTLVRKYSKSDLPEFVWLLEGNYYAYVEGGTKTSATFDESDKFYSGGAFFDITGGQSTDIDIVAVMQNIPVEVVFDQTIIDGFLDGYRVEIKANDEVKLDYTESKTGYFIMPTGFTALTWNFVGTFVYDDNGEQVKIDKSGTIENVETKKGYKLSFKFSKDASGTIGGLSVVLDDSIEEFDDHFSFNPDPKLDGVDFNVDAPQNYAGGERKYVATSPADFCAAKLLVGNREINLVEESIAGVTLSGLNTPKLYISLSDDLFNTLSEGRQVLELTVTDTSGGQVHKQLVYNLQGVRAYDKSKTNLWAGTTTISATIFGEPESVEIIYRNGEGEWQHSEASPAGENTYEGVISGLSAGHNYEYNLIVNGKTVGTSLNFTTETGVQIPNGDLEDWCKDGDGVIIPYHTSNNPYWCTGNYGTAVLSKNITQSSSDVRPGSTGTKSMYMDSEYIVVKFAAGNGYIGSWGRMDGTNATVYFGQPFSYNAKPKAIRFWAKWNCGTIDKVSGKVGQKGDPDLCKIFCCLTTDIHMVDSSDGKGTTFNPSDEDIKSGDTRYNKVLYSAYMATTESQTEWKQIEIPFTFYGTDPNQVPTHIILTFTCSGYGDFFDGSTDSWLYVDDIEFVY